MLEGLRRWFARALEPWPTTHRALAVEVAAVARSEGPATLVALLEARYLPHGGLDRVLVRLRPDGGSVERDRTPQRGDPRRRERDLAADESRRLIRELESRDVWSLGDHREAVKDGLVCGLAFAQGERAHSLQLHSGLTESKQLELLRLLTELAPIAESA